MNRLLLVPGVTAPPAIIPAKDSARADSGTMTLAQFEAAFKYRTGSMALRDGMAEVTLPDGYRYLDPEDTERVLGQARGDLAGSGTLGMIVPPGAGVTDGAGWAVIQPFDEDGLVKDDDAAKIAYDHLLKEMQEDSRGANVEREKAGYEPVTRMRWAARPKYAATQRPLYWAKEGQGRHVRHRGAGRPQNSPPTPGTSRC
jgi:uncharacterized membrane-anchored protein